ncbi:MAG: glucose-1-phosphate adenylyltransferase subunit GlgD [Eubacteriales bacterium]|nr:glucose-1-phosphate adenylyltransferase subunit GlgD [Eubacteriales bacterium]
MFIDAMGLILADHTRANLGDLEEPRSLAAVPFAGRYRIIDFTLSSLVNSGVKNVGVVANHKYRSLMDHLGTGAYWDLDRMQQGLSILPPFLISHHQDEQEGDLVGLYDFVRDATQNYVVICESNQVMNIDFGPYVQAAKASGAKMTILYNQDGNKSGQPYFLLGLDEDNYVNDLFLSPRELPTTNTALGIMILERDFLIQHLELEVARGRNKLSVENLLRLYEEEQIFALEYSGMILRINSLATYFQASQRFLEMDIFDLFFNQEDRPIYTKVKNEAPAMYLTGNKVVNSLLSDGCSVAGEVKDSIIFRGVQVGRHAVLDNCIIGQDCVISEGAELSYVILDKDTVIRPGVKLVGQPDYPVVIGKGVIV